MMNQPIFDMHAVAAEEFVTDDVSQSFLNKLMYSLAASAHDVEARDDLLQRADAYDESQPSFATDLRAAVNHEGTLALA